MSKNFCPSLYRGSDELNHMVLTHNSIYDDELTDSFTAFREHLRT